MKTHGVELSHTEDYDQEAYLEAMEQDFATGGNDDIFGSDLDSNITALKKILERLENPLSAVSEENAPFYANEKTFYTALLNSLA